jgi:hypothetical protein
MSVGLRVHTAGGGGPLARVSAPGFEQIDSARTFRLIVANTNFTTF